MAEAILRAVANLPILDISAYLIIEQLSLQHHSD